MEPNMEKYAEGYAKGVKLAKEGQLLPKPSKMRHADFKRGMNDGWLQYLMGV